MTGLNNAASVFPHPNSRSALIRTADDVADSIAKHSAWPPGRSACPGNTSQYTAFAVPLTISTSLVYDRQCRSVRRCCQFRSNAERHRSERRRRSVPRCDIVQIARRHDLRIGEPGLRRESLGPFSTDQRDHRYRDARPTVACQVRQPCALLPPYRSCRSGRPCPVRAIPAALERLHSLWRKD